MKKITIAEAREAKRAFVSEFLNKLDCEGIQCGLSFVGENKRKAKETERNDACIVVRGRKGIPKTISFPTEYRGVKVFVNRKPTGEILALDEG